MEGTLITLPEGKVEMKGVDHGGMGEILSQNKGAIVIKWPGHMGWYSRGGRKYYGARISVYLKVKTVSESEWYVEELISLDVKRKSS